MGKGTYGWAVQLWEVDGGGHGEMGDGTERDVPGTRYQLPGTWYQVPGTSQQVGTWYQVPGTRHMPRDGTGTLSQGRLSWTLVGILDVFMVATSAIVGICLLFKTQRCAVS